MNTKIISIIIPAYNASLYIEKCIRSLINQTYRNIEVIVINDGSTDDTEQIVYRLSQIDNRIKYISQANSGVSCARNKGIKEAKGDYIAFVDADDYVEKTFISNLLETIELEKCDICACGFVDEDENKNILHFSENKHYEVYDYKTYKLDNFLPYVCWQTLFSKSLIEKEKIFFNEHFSIKEDLLFIYEALVNSNKVCIIPDILYHSVLNDNSLTSELYSKKNFSKYKTEIDVYEKIVDCTYEKNKYLDIACLSAMKSSILLIFFMNEHDINDIFTKDKAKKLIKRTYNLLRKRPLPIKQKLIVLIIRYFPILYKKR